MEADLNFSSYWLSTAKWKQDKILASIQQIVRGYLTNLVVNWRLILIFPICIIYLVHSIITAAILVSPFILFPF